MRTDVIKTYKDIHSWVGIFSGLALFIAFYAGAITMFEDQLQRWASPPPALAAPVSLERTPELIEKTLAAYPAAAKSYSIHVETGPEQPARLSWTTGGRREGGPARSYFAALGPDGAVQVVQTGPSPVAQLIDILHQQVGLPFPHEISMLIMGAIALLYGIALVSGVIVLIPSLVKDLFALRIGKNLKRMWLDLHNMLGLFSLPFHIVMAFSAVVFAFHDQFYGAQGFVSNIGAAAPMQRERPKEPDTNTPLPAFLPPVGVIARMADQQPGFTVTAITYQTGKGGGQIRVAGHDPAYGMRGPVTGFAEMDPTSGDVTGADYLPGRQNGWQATLTSFFTLHFGSYGGAPVRWGYFLLGLAGAFLFYSGNLLWVESRRKKARRNNQPEQTRSSYVLGALTTGVSLGCITGISLTIASAKWLPADGRAALWHELIYYAAFLAAVCWAFQRGAARSGYELLIAASVATAAIPASSLAAFMSGSGWNHGGSNLLIDLVAAIGAVAFAIMARFSAARATQGQVDSIWSLHKPMAA